MKSYFWYMLLGLIEFLKFVAVVGVIVAGVIGVFWAFENHPTVFFIGLAAIFVLGFLPFVGVCKKMEK